MVKRLSKAPMTLLIAIISVLFAAVMILSILLASQTLANNRIETVQRTADLEIQDLESQLEEYQANFDQVLAIRDRYRHSIKQLFELVYNQAAPLNAGTGGSVTDVERSDEVLLLEVRNTIATMNDDQRILDEVFQFLETRREFINSFPFVWPVGTNGVPKITSGYGFREDVFNPFTEEVSFHGGIDLKGEDGDPVYATAEGRVLYTFYDHSLMGMLIVIQHRNGFSTGYGHLSAIHVREGQRVERGEIIGEIGNTGRSNGAHLHYEIRKDGATLDPLNFLTVNF